VQRGADEVIVVAGVAQAFALLAITLRRQGIRAVAVEDPCSVGARQQLQSWGMATPAVEVDERGVRVDELRASGAEVAMLTPAHQFPTGVVLDGERRRELRDWTGDGGLIIEDDYDAEHRYDRPPVPALRAVLPEHVCYTGSVSKLLRPRTANRLAASAGPVPRGAGGDQARQRSGQRRPSPTSARRTDGLR
jgi:GntR family transcriptional regulator/MocR family aminotransferase